MENEMDEGRKRTLGVIAAIFACRKLAVLDGKPSPAREMAFRDSIDFGRGNDAPDRFALALVETVEVSLHGHRAIMSELSDNRKLPVFLYS